MDAVQAYFLKMPDFEECHKSLKYVNENLIIKYFITFNKALDNPREERYERVILKDEKGRVECDVLNKLTSKEVE